MVELARAYAALIDEDEGMLDKLGRPFQRTLRELGLTPRSRAALPQAETQSSAPSPLDEIRASREQRLARFTAAAGADGAGSTLDRATSQVVTATNWDRQQRPEASRGGEW